jgi:hypothetical protein
MPDQPLTHLARVHPPWHTGPPMTECGRPVSDVAGQLMSEEELVRLIGRIGQKRAAFTTCMTCWETCARYRRGSQYALVGSEVQLPPGLPLWERDPAAVIRRSLDAGYRRHRVEENPAARRRAEWVALGVLVDRYGAEFAELVDALLPGRSVGDATRRMGIRAVPDVPGEPS